MVGQQMVFLEILEKKGALYVIQNLAESGKNGHWPIVGRFVASIFENRGDKGVLPVRRERVCFHREIEKVRKRFGNCFEKPG